MPDDATARNGAAGFAVGSKGYVTTGYTVYKDDDPMHTGGYAYLKDTWEYDPATNEWRQMDDYPGDARINAIAFTIGNYGYVGTGQSKDDKQTKDFYRFDPTAPSGSQWSIVNGFGGQKKSRLLILYHRQCSLHRRRNQQRSGCYRLLEIRSQQE